MSERSKSRPLSSPVKDVLRGSYPDATAADRVWRDVSRRRFESKGRAPWVRPLVAVALTCCTVVAVLLSRGSTPERAPSELPLNAAPLPLETVEGTPLEDALTASAGEPTRLVLNDGSSIARSADTRIAPLVNQDGIVRFLLEGGRIELDIRPGGRSKWTIECGIARVEVLGTRFAVRREQDAVEVSVMRGSVLVESTYLPEGARKLSVGEAVTIELPGLQATPTHELSSKGGPTPAQEAKQVKSRPRRDTPPTPEAKPSAARDGTATEQVTMSQLLRDADGMRARGDLAGASALIARAVEIHPRDPQTALAHFTRGRIELELGHPKVAISAFRLALQLGVPRALEEDVWFRLAEAYASDGDTAGLAKTIAGYRQKFPDGRRAQEMNRWSHVP